MELKKLKIVNVCLQTPDLKNILMINRIKEPYKGFWSMPGGKIELNELPEDAAVRELFEETGIRVDKKICAGKCLEKIYEDDKQIFEFEIYFFKFVADQDISEHDSKEGELKWLLFDSLKNYNIIPTDIWVINSFNDKYDEIECKVIKSGTEYILLNSKNEEVKQ